MICTINGSRGEFLGMSSNMSPWNYNLILFILEETASSCLIMDYQEVIPEGHVYHKPVLQRYDLGDII